MAQSRENIVAIVGAGLGGLAAALRLAHAGIEVVVVDRLDGPGGKLRTVESAAGPVDAGPTVLTLRDVFDDLFADVGEALSDHLTLVAEPVLARHSWPDGSTLDLFADARASAAAIADLMGAEAAADFRAFDAWAERLYRGFDAPMMRAVEPDMRRIMAAGLSSPGLLVAMEPTRTLAASLARRFRDPRLRQLFGRYATYVGGSPQASPALLALIWRAEARGVWRIKGGMNRLAAAIEAAARARGATFRYGAEAAEIEVTGGVTGLRLSDGSRISAGGVVFNGDPAALASGLLGRGAARAVQAAEVVPRAHSACVWTFAASTDAELAHHNVFFAADTRGEFDDLAAGRLPAEPTVYVCAQDRGIDRRPSGQERFEIIVNGPPLSLGHPSAAEYQSCHTRTFETLAQAGLHFDPEPGMDALTTPANFAGLFPGSDGSLYGRSPHGTTAALRRPVARTPVPGLYLAGGGVHPGPGMPMAALSGRHAAAAILSDLGSTSRSRRTATRGGMSTD